MLVVLANHLPPAVRGRMKLWFVEARPNVSVSGIKDSVADTVVNYLLEHCPAESGILMFQQSNKTPGYSIKGLGDPKRTIIQLSGLQLVMEKDSTI